MKNAFGIIGGMGPMASAEFYKLLTARTPAVRDQDHINLVIISDAQMPDRTAAILDEAHKEDRRVIEQKLLEDVDDLRRAGCRGFCITCNTAHYFAEPLAEKFPIPMISMISGAADELAGRFKDGRVGIMAAEGTLQSGIYQLQLKARGIEPVLLSQSARSAASSLIFGCIKAGRTADVELLRQIDAEVEDMKLDAVLLACTELSVIKQQGGFSSKYIDAMEILADNVVKFMRG